MQSKKLLSVLGVAALALTLIGAGCEKQASNAPEDGASKQMDAQNPNATPENNTPATNDPVNAGAFIKLDDIKGETSATTPGEKQTDKSSPDLAMKSDVKTFNVEGGMFYFNPKEIRVKKGNTVKIVFTNKEGFHDWGIDEFNARTAQIAAGKTETIQFVADKAGTFEYYCSVGNHRAQGMKGNLIVE